MAVFTPNWFPAEFRSLDDVDSQGLKIESRRLLMFSFFLKGYEIYHLYFQCEHPSMCGGFSIYFFLCCLSPRRLGFSGQTAFEIDLCQGFYLSKVKCCDLKLK